METKDNTSGVFVLRQDLGSMEKRHMDQKKGRKITLSLNKAEETPCQISGIR